jgi:DNA-binding PadR family transcriptional regulator
LLAQGPQHGYELKAAFEADLSPDSPLNFGQVYTTLERLERDGLAAHHVVAQHERPDKKVYRLTDAGRVELQRWLETPSATALDLRNETFLKLFLARRLAADGDGGGGGPQQVIAIERREAFERLAEATRARLRAESDGSPLQTILLLELAGYRLEAFIRWLERCEAALKGDGDHGGG